jgi:MFS family permease
VRGSQRWLTIGLTLTVTFTALEAISVATALPATLRDIGGLPFYGWAFSAFMLTNLIGLTFSGDEADRRGPAMPFMAGVVLFTTGLLIGGFAPSMPVVVLGRAVQGLGAGMIGSVSYVAVGRGYPETDKPRMLAVLSTAWVVPGLIGPVVAGLVAAQFGWRWIFLGLAPLPPLAMLLALPSLRQLDHPATGRMQWTRTAIAAQLTIGTALALAALAQSSLLVGLALLVTGAVIGVPALRRLLPVGTVRLAWGLPASIATAALLNLAFFGVDAFVPLTLTAIRGQTLTQAGLPLTSATVGWTAGAWVQARLASRGVRGSMVIAGVALMAIGVGGVLAVLLPGTPVWLAILAWGVAGVGMGLGFSTLSLVVLETAEQNQVGAASASLQLANVLGGAIGTGGGGVLVGRGSGTNQAVTLAPAILAQCVLMLMALALAVLSAARMRRR